MKLQSLQKRFRFPACRRIIQPKRYGIALRTNLRLQAQNFGYTIRRKLNRRTDSCTDDILACIRIPGVSGNGKACQMSSFREKLCPNHENQALMESILTCV